MIEVKIQIGAMAPGISEQLGKQGLQFKNPDDAKIAARHAIAINRLRIHELITYSQADKASRRLLRWIGKRIEFKPTSKSKETSND